MITRQIQIVRLGLVVGGAVLSAISLVELTSAAAADSFRERVEADWQRQDEARMNQLLRPGTLRFPGGELDWPGLGGQAATHGLCVPQATAPVVDGRLNDACWKDAAVPPLGPPDEQVQPSFRLLQDGQRFFVAATFPAGGEGCFGPPTTAQDAGGAVDGVKNGRYGFHTNLEPNPWWQVDLGARQAIAKIVVYNRLEYAPGFHNADNLVISTSDDGKLWTPIYENKGKAFGGIRDNKPLVVDFAAEKKAGIAARFLRIQLPSAAPIFLHLDEVEVYGPEPNKNLALGCPADQSSRSPWSRGGPLFVLGKVRVGLARRGEETIVTANGNPLPSEQAKVHRDSGKLMVEIALPLDALGGLPDQFIPYHSRPTPLAGHRSANILWPEPMKLGFGKNRLSIEVRGDEPWSADTELTLETISFTPTGPQRHEVLRRKLQAPGVVPVEFYLQEEGAVAVIATLARDATNICDGRAFFVPPVMETLDRAAVLAAQTGARRELDDLRARAEKLAAREKAEGSDREGRAALYREARWESRRAAFAHPAMQFGQLLFVKRFTQQSYPDVCLNHMPWVSRPGGDLCVLTLAGGENEGRVRNIIAGQLGPGHVHGMDLWWDAGRVVFGYAKAKSNEPPAGWLNRSESFRLRLEEEPTHIFEIGVDGKGLRQLTRGEWSDLDPTYLPNGEICFVSERCGYSLQCNEYDKDETSTNLYVMRPDGSNIRRLTVTKDGDYLPHALADGTIGYTRWEYEQRGWAHIQSLWTIRPDGTFADALFKQHFNNPWAVEDCRSIPGSNTLVGVAAGHHTLPAGPVIVIDPRKGMNSPRGISIVTPGVLPPEGGMSGAAVPEGGVLGTGGYYMNPWPLSPSHFLVASTFNGEYRVAGETDERGYALYLIDLYGTKELIYRDAEISCFTPIPLVPRPRPPILPDMTDPKASFAVCSVQSIGKGVPGIDPKRIKYLRIAHGVPWPYCNTFGGQRYEPDVKSVMINWNPVRVIGEVPVEADGSVNFRVPVDDPVYFQLLDENHMELRRMRSFISFQRGEVRGCVGCHETREEAGATPTVPLASAKEPLVPTPPPWGNRTISFLRDVQPVFDKHCAACHGGLKPAAGLDFSSGLTARHNRAYDTILQHKLVARSNVGDDARITMPLEFGSHRSPLVQTLRDGPCAKRAQLTQDDWYRLVTWIDCNGPYHDEFINKRRPQPPYDLAADSQLLGKLAAIHENRCSACHASGEITRLEWIDLRRPEATRFLDAPLAGSVAGRTKCKESVYKDTTDPDYRAARELVESAASKARQQPRRDVHVLAADRAQGQ